MGSTVDPNISVPLQSLDLGNIERRDAERDEAKASRRGAEKKLAQAEQRSIDQQQPAPRPTTSQPNRAADVAKPEPKGQTDAPKDQNPQKAAQANEAAQKAARTTRDQAVVYRQKIEQPKAKAAEPATPKAPTQAAQLGEAEIKKGGEDPTKADPTKQTTEAKPEAGHTGSAKADAGKAAGATAVADKSPAQDQGTNHGATGSQTAKAQPGETTTGHPLQQSDTPRDYGQLLSGKPRDLRTTAQAQPKAPKADAKGQPAQHQEVAKEAAPKAQGLLAALSKALKQLAGKNATPNTRPTPTTAQKPETNHAETTTAANQAEAPAELPQEEQPRVKMLLVSDGTHPEEAGHLEKALQYAQVERGQVVVMQSPALAQAAQAQKGQGKSEFQKISEGDKEIAGTEGEGKSEQQALQKSYLINRHRDRRSA